MRRKILMLVFTVMMVIGTALPALAATGPGGDPCTWDWDRYMWRAYGYEFWTCWSGDDSSGWSADMFWTPDWGYWTP
jgi:hypothetical protein